MADFRLWYSPAWRLFRMGLALAAVSSLHGLVAAPGWSFLGGSRAHAAEVLHVEPGGTCGGKSNCFSTLQGALDAAQPSATVWIADGAYPAGGMVVSGDELVLDGGWNSDFTSRPSVRVTVGPDEIDQMIIANGVVRVSKTRHLIRFWNPFSCPGGASFVARLTDTPTGQFWDASSGQYSAYQSRDSSELGPFSADLDCRFVWNFDAFSFQFPVGKKVSLELELSGQDYLLAPYDDGEFWCRNENESCGGAAGACCPGTTCESNGGQDFCSVVGPGAGSPVRGFASGTSLGPALIGSEAGAW